jgi:hypothetical protein
MTAETKIEFDRDRALEYDLDIPKAIPGYEELQDTLPNLRMLGKIFT